MLPANSSGSDFVPLSRELPRLDALLVKQLSPTSRRRRAVVSRAGHAGRQRMGLGILQAKMGGQLRWIHLLKQPLQNLLCVVIRNSHIHRSLRVTQGRC